MTSGQDFTFLSSHPFLLLFAPFPSCLLVGCVCFCFYLGCPPFLLPLPHSIHLSSSFLPWLLLSPFSFNFFKLIYLSVISYMCVITLVPLTSLPLILLPLFSSHWLSILGSHLFVLLLDALGLARAAGEGPGESLPSQYITKDNFLSFPSPLLPIAPLGVYMYGYICREQVHIEASGQTLVSFLRKMSATLVGVGLLPG